MHPKEQTKSAIEWCMARGQGFEPRFLGPEPSVLPLDDPRIFTRHSERSEESHHLTRDPSLCSG